MAPAGDAVADAHRLADHYARLFRGRYRGVRPPAPARLCAALAEARPRRAGADRRRRDLFERQTARRHSRRARRRASLGAIRALGLTPHGELAAGRVDEVKAAAAGEAEDRLG